MVHVEVKAPAMRSSEDRVARDSRMVENSSTNLDLEEAGGAVNDKDSYGGRREVKPDT